MPRISKAKIVFFILMIEAILSLSFFNLYADTQAKPQRPWYSETPNPRHIANYDRLTAEYFNNQLNVIYNWAQNTNAELDNLLHNGIGVASLTVGILNCTNKIINPEWDNLLHNGIGVASITVGLVKTQDLEISNKIDVPAIEFSGRSQPTPPVNNGMLYFDSDLQRFRVYQEDGWRDLSSNIVIASDSLTNPLIIQGYISASNIYATNSAVINKNLTVKENINSSGTATIQNVNILNDSTINRNLTVKGNINSSGTAYLKNLNVTDNSTINKNLTVKGKLNASGPAILESLKVNKTLKVPVTASTTLGVGSVYYDTTAGKLKVLNSSNTWDTVGNDIAIDSAMSSTSTNPVQNKVVNSYISQQLGSGTSNLYVRTLKTELALRLPIVGSNILGLGSIYYDPFWNRVRVYVNNSDDVFIDKDIKIKTGSHDGTIKVEEDDGVNFSTYEVAVKGLGTAAYSNVASFSAANHNHDSSYAAINHSHTYDSELNDSSTNAVQNKKIKAYIDSHSGGSDVASQTYSISSIPFCQFTNPHLKDNVVVWDEIDTAYRCSFSLYKISDDYKIIRLNLPFGFTQGSPFASGTYGASIAQSYYIYDIQPLIDGLEIESITAYSENNDVDVINARIIRSINSSYVKNPFCVVCDLKSTQLQADNVIINIVFRKFKNN